MGIHLSRGERVIRTITHKPVDRLPVNLELTDSFARKVATELNVAQAELLGILDNHIVYAYLNDTSRIENGVVYDNWGVGYDQLEGASIRVHPMADLDRVDDYIFPDPNDPVLLSSVRRIVNDYGQEFFIPIYQRWALFERACWLRGVENFLVDMMVNRSVAEWLLDKITDYQVQLAKRAVETGVDCGRTGDDWGGQQGLLFSPTLWRELIKPRIKKIWAVYQNAGLPIIHHSCGQIFDVLPDLVELGIDVLHPIQNVLPKRELKQRYGGEMTFYGGIDTQHVMPFGTPEDVKSDVENCIAVLGEGGGYVIGFAHTLTSETPIQNLYSVLEAIERYSQP